MSYESPHFPEGDKGDNLRELAAMHTLINMTDQDIERLIVDAQLSDDDIQTLKDLREWVTSRRAGGTNA